MLENAIEKDNFGQAIYTKLNLKIYDIWVLGVSNYFIWKCPTRKILSFYNNCVSNNHLDIGVGTGFFLDRCNFPTHQPRLALMDLNPNCLELASRHLSCYQPEIYQRNILEPIYFDGQKFDSIGLNYVLHCLPGTMLSKALVFEHIKPLLNPGGIVFGSTILTQGVQRNVLAQRLMKIYVKKRIFDNKNDSLDDLKKSLKSSFSESSVDIIGCVALFWGRF